MVELIEQYNELILDWICKYYLNGIYLLLAIVAFVYLYLSCKELRYKFLLPIFVILLIVVNPILYMYVFRRIIYWRLFWLLPTTILIATAIVILLKQINRGLVRLGVLLIVVFVISRGPCIFSEEVFGYIENWEKVSQETIDICDYLLSVDDTPRAIMPADVFSEVRQYAPEISMMYGRNAHGYITDILGEYMEVYQQIELENPNYDTVLYWATHFKCNFVVIDQNKEIAMEYLEKYGYKELECVAGYIVYYNEFLE